MLTRTCLNFIKTLKTRSKSSLKMRVNKPSLVKSCMDEDSSSLAAKLLSSGNVIALPTDTIYGLACSANSAEAIKKLYAIKGRDAAKPVAICVTTVEDVGKWGKIEHIQEEVLEELLPGPVTVVLERTPYLNNPFLNPTTSKIGIRIPKHDFVNSVTELFDMPIALTSANFSHEPSTLSVKEFEPLYDSLGAVFDGGTLCSSRSGSTVVDLSTPKLYKIVRPGSALNEVTTVLVKHGFKQDL